VENVLKIYTHEYGVGELFLKKIQKDTFPCLWIWEWVK
jgi:hypothetical protein